LKKNLIKLMTIGLGILVLTTLFSGCSGKLSGSAKVDEKALVIPDFPTANEQFQYAKFYQNSQLISPELDRRRNQMMKIGQCFNRVLINFPNDTVYVPLTYLELGDCAAQSDEFLKAIEFYQQAGASSQDDFVQARSQYSIARIYNIQGKYEEAKAIYKSIIDRYSKSESGKVRDVVKRSAQLYYQVVDPATAKKE